MHRSANCANINKRTRETGGVEGSQGEPRGELKMYNRIFRDYISVFQLNGAQVN